MILFAPIAERTVRFLSSLLRESLFIAGIASASEDREKAGF